MKRVWFAIAFICLTFIACIFEQLYVQSFCEELNAQTDYAIAALNDNNDEEYSNRINRIQSVWKQKNDILYCVSNHVLLDELSFRINSAKDIKNAVFEVKAVVNAVYENNRIKISNIF